MADLPNVDFPTIQVNASLPGASPETMASAVALPLEKQFATIAGVTSISSSSFQGSTSITLQFDLSRNIDAAAQDVQSQIARTARSLPPQMPAPPSYQKVNPTDFPVTILVLESDTLPLSTLDEYAQSTIAQRLSMISGVAQVNVMGSQKYAVRIDVDPRALASKGIGIDEVATAVQNANVNVPTGSIQGAEQQYVVQTNGQLMRAAAFGPTIISYRNGTPVRLDEVAHVFDGVENDKSANWSNDKRAIVMMVNKQPGSNIVAIADAVIAMLPNIREQLPPSVNLYMQVDRSAPIRESVHDVKLTLGADGRPGRPGDLPVPAEPVGNGDSQPGPAGLDRVHLRDHVPARLQREQPDADGAHPRGRLRRRRRDRDAREHRPPHGDGQVGVAGVARRVEGSRVHDSLDDAVAGDGVRAGAVHGRHRRTAAATSSR